MNRCDPQIRGLFWPGGLAKAARSDIVLLLPTRWPVSCGCRVPPPDPKPSTPTSSRRPRQVRDLTGTERNAWLPRRAGAGRVCRRPLLGSIGAVGGGQAHGEASRHVGTGRSSLERLSYRGMLGVGAVV